MTDPTALRALAEAAKAARTKYRATGEADDGLAFYAAIEALNDAVNEDMILELLADRERGAADTRRLDWLETEEWNHRANEYLRATSKVRGRIRAAIDHAMQTPSEPDANGR